MTVVFLHWCLICATLLRVVHVICKLTYSLQSNVLEFVPGMAIKALNTEQFYIPVTSSKLTVAHSKQGMGVEVFLRQCEQWLTRKIGSSTAAYGSSLRMTSPGKVFN